MSKHFEALEKLYAQKGAEEPFANYVIEHAKNGFVYSTPDFFVMGRPVVRSASEAVIRDATHAFPPAECDAWFVHAAAGNIPKMWATMPWPLEWIGWTRLRDPLDELTFVRTESLKRLCPPDFQP